MNKLGFALPVLFGSCLPGLSWQVAGKWEGQTQRQAAGSPFPLAVPTLPKPHPGPGGILPEDQGGRPEI